ncbi:ABC-2 type transport system ATP-binding protein [Vibrio xiamenensis]|uniref:ABC-2 type transport system ATP-binding protein n=1 Tax=Vibrio xiamenensis TaxID=861298 RepID=A0A1G7Z5C0_9VIBR|nr:ABC transporter ATP-binding protein [Vibrio xiamenensis]SDH03941.1 ABC-2 type transport system ATP-binding protein [Vibrio xiamenensis]
MSELAIKARNISKTFADFTAIDNISLSVPKGKIYGFLGPNGCGKSTTIRVLTGLLTPSGGEVEVLGYSMPKQADQLRRHIGYMTQKFSLYQDLNAEENLRFIGTIFGLRGRELKQRCEQQIATYGLSELRRQLVSGMSGGQKQRLSLAAATIHRPKLLFLDEPTSAVDPENRRDFWEKLFDLSEAGTTILVTTHYMDEAERCHRLAIMEAGQLRADDEPERLMANMGVNIVEVKAPNLRQLKAELLTRPQVRSAAQLGVRLRVLIYQQVLDPIAWLRGEFPTLSQAELSIARPTLEDVFVSVTGEHS